MSLSNFDKWASITEGLPSPQNYIDFGFYYTIAASLQRRVWLGPTHLKCYPNMFIIPVGSPGIGKGVIINQINKILRMHYLDGTSFNDKAVLSEADKAAMQAMSQSDVDKAAKDNVMGKSSSKLPDKKLLIPVAANAVTYEALIQAMASSKRRINYIQDWSDGKKTMEIYTHCSLCFCLPELGSLFRKRTEDTINFLLEAYDCVDTYEYDTKTQGKDKIWKCCLNLFGGTTPDFISTVFDDRLLGQGFSSRTFFLFAAKNRKSVFWVSELTDEQKQYEKDIADHVLALTKLYGQVKIDAATEKFLVEWWEESNQNKKTNTRLVPFEARENIHVMKLAMAIHFGESTEMFIPLETFKKAIEVIANEKKTMHLALDLEGNSELSKVTRKIENLLHRAGDEGLLFNHIWAEVYNLCPRRTDIEEVLSNLIILDKVATTSKVDETTQENVRMFKLK